MIALYTLALAFLNALKFLLYLKAKASEKRFARVSLAATQLANEPIALRGNSKHSDPCLSARRQFELGRLVQMRDRIESKHFGWQIRYERLARAVCTLRDWRGKKLPYLFGIIDVSVVLSVLDLAGLGTIDLSQLFQTIQVLLSK